MDVDHFEPANQSPFRLYDWTNLYPAAHKANMLRPRTLPPGGLLDPCVDDVEGEIIYTLVAHGEEAGFRARDSTNQKAVNTAVLLDKIHNGTGSPNGRQNTRELRYLIEKRYKELLLAWGEYHRTLKENDLQDIAQAESELRVLLSRKASFTMLMRSLPFVRKTVPINLLD